MRILLINPNRYQSPPVPPVGLEYLAASLENEGHETYILDLCFSDNIYDDIDMTIGSFRPGIAGITVRNADSVLYHTNEFFLDSIKDIINHIKNNYGIKVIAGGTAVSTNPEGVLEYLGADFAVAGPGEKTILELLNKVNDSGNTKRLWHGRLITGSRCLRKSGQIDYKRYYGAGGIAGFETHKGCSSYCNYCIEANSKIFLKNIDDVITEIKWFIHRGYNHFHLCDSEFNEDLDYSIGFCKALKESGLDIKWTAYMRPVEFSRRLFSLMKDTGVYLVTLTVDSYKKCTMYWSDIEKFVFMAKSSGLKIAIDFLTGFPYEKDEHILECIGILRRLMPDSINVNTYIRLYKKTRITDIIMRDPELIKYILKNVDDPTFIRPVFYNHISTEKLRKMLGDDPVFRIEGLEKAVNYIRV